MPLTRDQITTLPEALRSRGLSPRLLRQLQKRLRGQALTHLGWQEGRGWFFRVADVEAALAALRVPRPKDGPQGP